MNKEKTENLKLNLIFNIVYQVIAVVSPIIITPKLSRIFGPDYLGIKSYTFTIVYYFSIFGLLGLDMLGQREIALNKDDFEKRSKIFWTIFITRFILVFISLLAFLGFIFLFSESNLEKIVFLCWGIFLIREMINPIWFLQGIEKYRFLSILSIISNVLYVSVTFIFINSKENLPLYILFFTGIPLIISIMYFPLVLKNTKFIRIEYKDMIMYIKKSIVYFIPTIATAIYSMVDKTMLGIFDKSKVSTGLYESAEKLIKVSLAISTASYTIMRTRMSYLFGQGDQENYKKYSKMFISFSMMLCWPIMFGVIGISKDFVPLFFGSGFEEVTKLAYVFSLVVPCLTVSGLLQAIYIYPYGLQKNMDFYYVYIVITNIILNLLFISLFNTIGAIIATIIAELTLAIILMIKARKEIDVKYIFKSSIKYIIASVGMLLTIILISQYTNISRIYKIVLEFCSAVATYFILCFILRDKFVINETNSVLRKIIKR